LTFARFSGNKTTYLTGTAATRTQPMNPNVPSSHFSSLRLTLAAALLLSALCPPAGRAAQILLNAPIGGGSYYGMYTPHATEASFTLGGTYFVSTISATFRTPASTTFTTFHFSLQNAVTNPLTMYASQDVTAALGTASTELFNVNQTLSPGTYYLAAVVPGYAGSPATPGDVDGWLLSSGVYNQSAGTIVNGVYVAADPVVFDTGGVYVAPAFTVNGSLVPEPSACSILAAATASLLALRGRKHRLRPAAPSRRPAHHQEP
jgi:hypothetical protein